MVVVGSETEAIEYLYSGKTKVIDRKSYYHHIVILGEYMCKNCSIKTFYKKTYYKLCGPCQWLSTCNHPQGEKGRLRTLINRRWQVLLYQKERG